MFFVYIYKKKYMQKKDWSAGNKFGRLMTTGKSYNDERSRRYVEIICDCGTNKWMRFDTLVRSESCGCIGHEKNRLNPSNLKHGLNGHPLWNVYRSIKDRCYRKSSNRHKNYGELGCIMCKEWYDSYENFYHWAIDKWKPGLQLDKDILYKAKYGTDTGKIYSPEFCCFVTAKENNRNRTTSRFLEYNGQKKTSAEWADIIGITQQTISNRLNNLGWSIERTLSQPLKKNKRTVITIAR